MSKQNNSTVLNEDTYFYIPEDDNYVLKRKGTTVSLIVGGAEAMKPITREEFNAGVKRLAQENTKVKKGSSDD